MRKFLITSALPYANGPLHFGHIAGAYLPADAYARFQRLQGEDVLYICGSDEYGVAITLSAEMAGRSPKEHVDIFHKINLDFFEKMHFSFDHYSRTTWEGHTKTVQEFFLQLLQNGYIEEREVDQLYSEKEKRFLADRYVAGTCPRCAYPEARGDECQNCGASYEATDLKNPRSKLTGSPLVLRKSKHLYLLFDRFKERLLEWIKTKEWKPNVVSFAMHYIQELKARAITRDSDWGRPVPLPNSEGKVFYVWFDAPIGYISATQEWAIKNKTPDAWRKYWMEEDTTLVNFIGKDNIPFHAVFFPAMIMGRNENSHQSLKLVDEIPANEFLTLEGKQFSKSDGWYIDLADFFQRYTPDQIRYFLAANAPETADSEFSWKEFQARCNSELLGKLGNLVHRTLIFVQREYKGKMPPKAPLAHYDKDFLKEIVRCSDNIREAYQSFSLRKASAQVMELASIANSYFDFKKPWELAKHNKKEELAATFHCLLECIKLLALTSFPIIPHSAEKIWQFLGYTSPLAKQRWADVVKEPIPSDHHLKEPHHLFRKVEDEEIEKEMEKLLNRKKKEPTMTQDTYSALKPLISFDQFQNLDLRVAQVLEAESVPKSKRLLRLTLDLGFEKRCVVSGIAEHYKPEDLIGKKVLFVANLQPATIMGIQSQGMVLAASFDKTLELPFLDRLQPGSIVS
ncbi:MAG TPA: methionine--tRNA ligase [Chlamydiales bacterium]|nr:methionine--tRNA ligase [Chlamydiales bacterium]